MGIILKAHGLRTLFGLVLALILAGCATFRSDQLEAEELEALEAREEFRQHLVEEIKDVIRHEVVPEIKNLSPVSPALRDRQARAQDMAAGKVVIGRIEWVEFESPGFSVQARIDTGAQTSSLHAENIEEKNIDGELYVQFETFDQSGEKYVLLKRVINSTVVRRSTGESAHRYVVKTRIQLGGQSHEINVNLNDRSGLRYRFLAGRNLLMGNYVVDVSQSRILGR